MNTVVKSDSRGKTMEKRTTTHSVRKTPAHRIPGTLGALFILMLATITFPVHAGDVKYMLPIAGAMNSNDARTKLGDDVRFYFGDEATPRVVNHLGTDKANQKTNSFRKTPEAVCNWVFLSNLLSLKKRAEALGANGVIHITNIYNGQENPSNTKFECHVGSFFAGVALQAEFVSFSKR